MKRPLNEGRWKVARHEPKREIRIVGRPAGTEATERNRNLPRCYFTLPSPQTISPLSPVVSFTLHKRKGRIDEGGGCLVMQTFDEDMPLVFRPRVRSSNVLRMSGLTGEGEEGGMEGDRPSELIRASSCSTFHVDRCLIVVRNGSRNVDTSIIGGGGGVVVAACYCYIGKYCWERDDGFDGDFFDLSSMDL